MDALMRIIDREVDAVRMEYATALAREDGGTYDLCDGADKPHAPSK